MPFQKLVQLLLRAQLELRLSEKHWNRPDIKPVGSSLPGDATSGLFSSRNPCLTTLGLSSPLVCELNCHYSLLTPDWLLLLLSLSLSENHVLSLTLPPALPVLPTLPPPCDQPQSAQRATHSRALASGLAAEGTVTWRESWPQRDLQPPCCRLPSVGCETKNSAPPISFPSPADQKGPDKDI